MVYLVSYLLILMNASLLPHVSNQYKALIM